ncbi:MAG: hypothetical protein AABZ06_14370 [Bdellovibrionota bacterium]
MEKTRLISRRRLDSLGKFLFFFSLLAAVAGMILVFSAQTEEKRVIYPKKTQLDFEGTQIEGEVRNPGEFYFQHRTEEKFDSLVKRRKNFHREMLRDVVLSK